MKENQNLKSKINTEELEKKTPEEKSKHVVTINSEAAANIAGYRVATLKKIGIPRCASE